jgi:hypothetical protein
MGYKEVLPAVRSALYGAILFLEIECTRECRRWIKAPYIPEVKETVKSMTLVGMPDSESLRRLRIRLDRIFNL